MESNENNVGMADLKVLQSPASLTSLGIGSCVAVTMYDAQAKIGGMAHIMLPDINAVKNRTNRAKFANTAIPDMLEKMIEMGADKQAIKVKLMGGAHMFGFSQTEAIFNIGKRNVEMAKNTLRELGIRIVAEETGGSYGRSLYFDLETGKVRVRTIAHGEKVL